MAEILIGFVLASICAVLCAIAMVHSRRVEAVLEPFLVVSQVIPKVALAPLFIIWFGHGILPKIIIAMLIAFFLCQRMLLSDCDRSTARSLN